MPVGGKLTGKALSPAWNSFFRKCEPMNELLWISFALLDLAAVVLMFRLFGRIGCYAMVVLSLLVCNIQVLKTVTLFGLTTTLGNVLYASVFLATDILSEFYGRKEARRAVLLGFCCLVLATAYMQVALLFVPAPSDFAQPHLQAVFGILPRVTMASLAAYLVSQLHDVWAYELLRRRTKGRHLWLRNNMSTMISQIMDSFIFCALAFAYVFPWDVWLQILFTTILFKLVVALLDTPFIYLAKHLSKAGNAVSPSTAKEQA